LNSGTEVRVWLSDIDPPRRLRLFKATTSSTVITSCRVRHIPVKGWSWQVVNLSHVDCGGAMNGQWSFFIYRNQASAPITLLERLPGRDITASLDPLLWGTPCQPPVIFTPSSLGVHQIHHNIYHSAGLFPTEAITPVFITPCTFSPTKWVKRKLTGIELCRIKDVPETALSILSPTQIA
jgi:hypothetical protein